VKRLPLQGFTSSGTSIPLTFVECDDKYPSAIEQIFELGKLILCRHQDGRFSLHVPIIVASLPTYIRQVIADWNVQERKPTLCKIQESVIDNVEAIVQ
jgi:hypothetical protein